MILLVRLRKRNPQAKWRCCDMTKPRMTYDDLAVLLAAGQVQIDAIFDRGAVDIELALTPSGLPAAEPPRVAPLTQILAGLIGQARLHPGQAQRRELRSGMRVDVLAAGGKLHLQISREGVYPSETEWSTTLAYLPEDPPLDTYPVQQEKDGRNYLRTSWEDKC